MGLSVKAVTGNSRSIKRIYREAFPKAERMPFLMMRLMSKMKNTEFLSFCDQDIICGFVYMATVDPITFVMFLAVDTSIRSRGYGRQILDQVHLLHPNNKMIVSIEQCHVDAENIEQRLRRKRFYTNNGYLETGYIIELSKVKQEILIKNGAFEKDEFAAFLKNYSNGAIKPLIWRAGTE